MYNITIDIYTGFTTIDSSINQKFEIFILEPLSPLLGLRPLNLTVGDAPKNSPSASPAFECSS